MSGASVATKVKKGLGKVTKALGSGDLIYLVQTTTTPGNPLAPGTVTTENILLKDAVLSSITINQFSNSSAVDGDKKLVVGADVELSVGNKIKQGSVTMTVKSVKSHKPSGVMLAQECIVGGQ